MDFDPQRFSRFAPLGLPLAVVVAGWMLVVQPQVSDNARVAKEIDDLRQQLATVRSSAANPLPAKPADHALARFEHDAAALDPTSELLEQLARLAATARVANLLIETGERVTVGGNTASGPQVVGANAADPRFALFTMPLAYSPVTMSFDAEYPRAGNLLWSLRDLATTVEVRDFEARPIAQEATAGDARLPKIHVVLTLFAYARATPVVSGGASGPAMTLDKRHMAGSVLMLAAAIAYNVWVFTRPATRLAAAPAPIDILGAPSASGNVVERSAASDLAQAPLPDVEIERVPQWPRDPFEGMHKAPEVVEAAPAPPPPVVEPDPVVASILYSTGRRLAVIDGHIVRPNDSVGTARVIDILPTAVVLEFADGDRRTVELQALTTGRGRR